MSKENYEVCCCFLRRFKLGKAEAPAEIKEMFDLYSENGIMTVHHLQRFMTVVQGDHKATTEDAEALMETILKEYKHHVFHHKGLDLEVFFRYLLGDINPPLPSPPKVHHDMTAPLSHYFIYTGHNSYLTGNQLNSNCSDVPIIDALHRGVRVIELDMWPNSTKDDVHILHGGYGISMHACFHDNMYSASKNESPI